MSLPFPSYYIAGLFFQGFCVWHCVRRGHNQQWIWMIVFLPVIGCLVYLFSEVLTRSPVHGVQKGLGDLLLPGASIRRLEKELRFADTMANRLRLADAYAATGDRARAISLYESCLSGPFEDNEHVYMKLLPCYFDEKHFAGVLAIARKVYRLPEFQRSRNHLLYALALEQTGDPAAAEAEFAYMQGRYAFFEARYEYGRYLLRHGRPDEARLLFGQLVEEGRDLSGHERRQAREWVRKAKNNVLIG